MNAQPTNTPSARTQTILSIMLALLILAAAASVLLVGHMRFTVQGAVTDALTGAPLADVEVSAGSLSVRSNAQGRYMLLRAPRDGQFAFFLDGYQPAQPPALAAAWLETSISLDVALQPGVLEGTVSDGATRQPIVGASVSVDDEAAVTTVEGAYRFLRVKRDAPVVVRAAGYDERRLTFSGEANLPIALEQNTVTARATDGRDGARLSHASLRYDGQAALPAADGSFVLRGVKQQAEISMQADGFLPATTRFTGAPALVITLTANTVGGIVCDQATGQPLNGITITVQHAGSQFATLSNSGGFQLRAVRSGAVISAGGPDHATSVITYTGQPSLTLALRPDTLRGVVRDRFTGQPMPGITVSLQEAGATRTVRSDEGGRFALTHVPFNAIVSGAAPAYATTAITYTGQMSIELSLRPDTLRGVVRDSRNGQPVAGAEVSAGSISTTSAANGAYALAGIPEGASLSVSAAGHDRVRVDIGQLTTLDVRVGSLTARGIFIPFYLLTVPERVQSLIDFAGRAGMTVIVVDIKGDDGYLAYRSDTTLAKEIKPQFQGSMMGLDEVLRLAKQRGMYTIARMVVFKDNLLVEARPDLSVTDSRTGQPWDDCGNGSTLWADPFRKEVVDYNAGIAEEAAHMGFDEVQFDYVRFPPACIQGAGLAYARYAVTSTMETRIAAIETFLAEARRRVRPLGVALAVDTFGWTMFRDDDLMIGQRIENMAKYVDYICPMVYPSTWEVGALGLDYVPAHPYEVVYQSIKFAMNRLKATPGVKIRPWLQDFDDYQSRELTYGVRELDLQRRGAADAGAEGWMLWNAGGVYTEETSP